MGRVLGLGVVRGVVHVGVGAIAGGAAEIEVQIGRVHIRGEHLAARAAHDEHGHAAVVEVDAVRIGIQLRAGGIGRDKAALAIEHARLPLRRRVVDVQGRAELDPVAALIVPQDREAVAHANKAADRRRRRLAGRAIAGKGKGLRAAVLSRWIV